MAKVIVIKGAKDAGKTTALRYIMEVLIYLGARVTIYKPYNKTYIYRGDFEAELVLRGKTIAIRSMGDSPNAAPSYIKQHSSSDIVIVATRNEPDFTNRIGSVPDTLWFDKDINHGKPYEDQYNDLGDFVRKVVGEIQQLIP